MRGLSLPIDGTWTERQGLAGRFGGAPEPLHEAAILESVEGEAEALLAQGPTPLPVATAMQGEPRALAQAMSFGVSPMTTISSACLGTPNGKGDATCAT